MDLLLHNLRTGGIRHDDWSVAREAADEIERLREALKKHDAWLGQAHVLCSNLGVPPGHIEDRLFEAIGKVPNVKSTTSCRPSGNAVQ